MSSTGVSRGHRHAHQGRKKFKMPGGAPVRTALDRDGIITILVRTPLTRSRMRDDASAEKPHRRQHQQQQHQPPVQTQSRHPENDATRESYDIAACEWCVDAARDGAQVTHYETAEEAAPPVRLASIRTLPTMSMTVDVKNFGELKDNLPVSNYQLPPSIAIRYWTVKPYDFKPYMRVQDEERYMHGEGTAKLAHKVPAAGQPIRYATTNLLCWHDCHPIRGIPFPIPWRKSRRYGIYDVYGLFCCPGCARAYNRTWSVVACRDTADAFIIEIAMKYYRCERATTGFPMAPAREALEAFGGVLSIDEFRRLAGYNAETKVDMYLPFEIVPMTFVERSIVNTNRERVTSANDERKRGGGGGGEPNGTRASPLPSSPSSSLRDRPSSSARRSRPAFDGAFRASTDGTDSSRPDDQRENAWEREAAKRRLSAPDGLLVAAAESRQLVQSPPLSSRRKFGGTCFGQCQSPAPAASPPPVFSPVLFSPPRHFAAPPPHAPAPAPSRRSSYVDSTAAAPCVGGTALGEEDVSAFVHDINVSTRPSAQPPPPARAEHPSTGPPTPSTNKFIEKMMHREGDAENGIACGDPRDVDADTGSTDPVAPELSPAAPPSFRSSLSDNGAPAGFIRDCSPLREAKFNKWKQMRDKYYRGGIPKLTPSKTQTARGNAVAPTPPASRKRKARASASEEGQPPAKKAKKRTDDVAGTGNDWRTAVRPSDAQVEAQAAGAGDATTTTRVAEETRQTLSLKGKDHGGQSISAVLQTIVGADFDPT
jgi:hypothetical protein